ncbi:MAG: UDP-N-acetylmuramoyl-L-alanyl-D-glutamate--2,6-diaminopimelate ligase [Desulfovermiculus sp.]
MRGNNRKPQDRFSTWDELLKYVRQGAEVRTHSQQVQPGDVFVALPGAHTDGSDYIPQAVDRYAAWVVHPQHFKPGRTEARVRFWASPDPGNALGALAAAKHKTDERKPFLVGITGTNGKTTVSYLTEHLLRSAGKECGVLGTISYRWKGKERHADLTTPGCLELHAMLAEMAEDGVEVVCMEVSSHALDQQRTAGLAFDLAVFTNLTQDHLDYHQDMETYFQVKSRLFTTPPWASILNLDDEYGLRLAGLSKPGRGYSLNNVEVSDWPCLQGSVLQMERAGQVLGLHEQRVGQWSLRSGLVGRHNASNLLAAQAIGLELGLGPQDFKALESCAGPPGRLQRVPNKLGLHVFVDYAHTPDALNNVLSALKELNFQRLIVVFGCGGDRDPGKRPLMGQAVARHADLAVLTSDNPRHEDPEQIMHGVMPGLQGCPQVMRNPDRRQAIYMGLEATGPLDALVIAGKGHECTQQIGDQKLPFSDVQVVREYLDDVEVPEG